MALVRIGAHGPGESGMQGRPTGPGQLRGRGFSQDSNHDTTRRIEKAFLPCEKFTLTLLTYYLHTYPCRAPLLDADVVLLDDVRVALAQHLEIVRHPGRIAVVDLEARRREPLP